MDSKYKVILFYKFIEIPDLEEFVEKHKEKCKELGILGRMLVSTEGINGTFEGTDEAIETYKDFIHSDPLFSDLLIKESQGNGKAFTRLSIKIRDEIVTLGIKDFDVKNETATELPADEFQKWYENNEDFVVLDLRNDYEIACGKFDRTIDPGLSNFRDLPEKIAELKELKDKKVVTVCTGGIRCEKATCLLKREGFSDIYQLKDGIHTYMQQYPGQHFRGTLFVFDNRMTTDVVETPNREVVGKCSFCDTPSEHYCCDDTVRPSKKMICCETCFETRKETLRKCVVSND